MAITQIQLACLIAGAAGLVVGVIAALLYARAHQRSARIAAERLAEMEKAALVDKLADRRQQLDVLQREFAATTAQSDQQRRELAELAAEKAALARGCERIPQLEQSLAENRAETDRLQAMNLALEKRLAETTTRLDAERLQTQEKIALLNEARERLSAEFKLLAESILEEKGRTFAEQSRSQMDGLIGPLRQQLGDFKKRVEDVYDRESRDRAALFNEISHLKSLNERIGKDALNLTQALKGDVKTLGNWGEVVLQRLLEDSGLEKGRAFDTQVSLTDSHGRRYQPDVIVRLPEDRDVVVDAKVSLKAYARYHAATDENVRAAAMKEHLASLRAHLKGLGDKRYADLEGLRSLDFVLMFVPVEAAFFAALAQDGALFTDAFEKNVILVCPSTLLVTLRIIHNIWRFSDQNANALEIARQAGGLVDKFVGFVEALETVGSQLDRARDAYLTARDRLATGRGNLVRRAEQLRALGVKASKTLPDSYTAQIDDGPDENDGPATGKEN